MRNFFLPYGSLPAVATFTLLSLTNCVNTDKNKSTATTTTQGTTTPEAVAAPNPLLEKWKGPFGGVPPFDKVKVSDIRPGLETAMAKNLQEVEAIAAQTTPA